MVEGYYAVESRFGHLEPQRKVGPPNHQCNTYLPMLKVDDTNSQFAQNHRN
jgi:hypothetical protein